MSVCAQSGPTEEDSASEEVAATAREKLDIYKQKPASKVVRVLTVLAYLLSVSLVAILLSVYYTCVWKSPEWPQNDVSLPQARRGNHSDYEHNSNFETSVNRTGGGNSTVNSSIIYSATNNSDPANMNLDSESLTDFSQYSSELPNTTIEGTINGTMDDIGTYSTTDIST